MEDCDEEEQEEAMMHALKVSFVSKSNGEHSGDLKSAARDMLQSHSAAGFNYNVDSIDDIDEYASHKGTTLTIPCSHSYKAFFINMTCFT
eukprot:13863070-Ditylum_brightwellii.AAC.1